MTLTFDGGQLALVLLVAVVVFTRDRAMAFRTATYYGTPTGPL